MSIVEFEKSWEDFKKYVEKKIEGRCILTNKNWKKLEEWHANNFIKKKNNAFEYLFNIKYFERDKYLMYPELQRLYGIKKRERTIGMENGK